MNKKLLLCLSCFVLLSSCGNNVSSSSASNSSEVESSTTILEDSYQIRIIDIDGEVLGEKQIKLTDQTKVFDDLVANFDVDYIIGEFGPYISSINGSITDSYYYLSIYENNAPSMTGIDGLVADNKDVFEFIVECWNTVESGYGTFDSYDLLVDKVIYGYMKTLDLSKSTTFTDGSFWDLMTINLARNNYYDTNLFNFDNISETVKSEIESYDIKALSNANLYKYYLYSKALNKDLTALKTYAESYISTLDDTYNAYVTPFIVAAAKGLNISSEKISNFAKATISTNYTWGPDVPVWQYATSLLYNDSLGDETLLKCVEKLDYGNSCSNAIVLQAFAAKNENIRDSKYEVDGKDLIEVLFDNYYNKDNNTLEYSKGVANTFSANQTIASLMAYKVWRDNNKEVNIYE